MWTALILGILGLASAIASGVSSYKATKLTNEMNQANYEDWKEYNTPSNQMGRLSEAGLNPYMVNGVSNTLSQPFSVQNNQGISSLFSQFTSAAAQTVSGLNQAESNEIARINADTKKDQMELNKIGMDLRKQMVDIARKKGDAYTALLWAQGSIAELNANFWRDVKDIRYNKYVSDATVAAQNADYVAALNPMRLDYYSSFYPAMLENLSARTALTNKQNSHLSWSELFAQERFNRMLDWQQERFKNQFGLAQDYYSLANAKYRLARSKYRLERGLGMSKHLNTWFDNYLNFAKMPMDFFSRIF